MFCEGTRKREVEPGENEGNDENENEEHHGVGVEGEIVAGLIYATAREGLVGAIAFERDTTYGDEAEESEDELREASCQYGCLQNAQPLRMGKGKMVKRLLIYRPKDHCILVYQS